MKTNQLSESLKTIILDQKLKLSVFTDEQWSHKPIPEKWSRKEILGHLIDSAFNNLQRFVRIQYEDQTNIYYDQDFWVKAGNYQNQDASSILKFWELINFQIATTWESTPDDQLSKTIPVMDEFPTLQFLMEDYIVHLNHHLDQIFK